MLATERPSSPAEPALKRVPLHDLHVARGGKIVPFAGYEMPVQYAAGVLKEHLHTRASAGLFDVSHMGQIVLRPKSGKVEDAARALERLVPQDIVAIAPGRQRYAQFTSDSGGILDDLMVANFGDHLFLVVNAACKTEDEAHLRKHLSDVCIIEPLTDRALIALQGPKAVEVLAKAQTIYLIGLRRSFPIASYMAYAFGKLGVRSILVDAVGGLAAEQLTFATKKDAVLAISFTPYASETISLAQAAHQKGVPVAAITDSPFSPLAQLANLWIEVSEANFEGFRSMAATLTLAMTLTVAIAERQGETRAG